MGQTDRSWEGTRAHLQHNDEINAEFGNFGHLGREN